MLDQERLQEAPPEALIEPTTGRPVLMAPRRQRRPKLSHDPSAGPCPFCPGAEHETPPEVDAVRAAPSTGDGPGWRVRAFPNKYPGGPHHEVVAEGDLHCQQPGELDPTIWAEVIAIWQRRIRAIEQRPGVACAFLFKNVGALAGASIVHNHSQLLGLPELPPRLQLEQERAAAMDRCPWCAALEGAEVQGRTIVQTVAHAVFAPEVPRLPHETWLAPLDCGDDFLTTDVGSLASALHQLFRAVQQGLDNPPFNLWLHRIPASPFHWHFELQPRTSQLAGLELGGDLSINSVPPTQSAARLRQGLDGSRRATAK
jgi:UDPglucose--hexose-1-phosphate uridylyltransferase